MHRLSLVFIILILGQTVVRSQDQTVINGIKSYQAGDFTAAIDQLKDTNDPIGLRFLGRSYESVGKKKDAAASFHRSLNTGYDAFKSALAAWQTSTSVSSLSTVLQNLDEVFSASVASSEDVVRLDKNLSRSNELRMKANVLYKLGEASRTGIEFYRSRDVSVPYKMLGRQPSPSVVGTACQGVKGSVRLQLLLFPDGKSLLVVPSSKWLAGCSEVAILAAAKIKFQPATKDGKPVGSLMLFDYGFN